MLRSAATVLVWLAASVLAKEKRQSYQVSAGMSQISDARQTHNLTPDGYYHNRYVRETQEERSDRRQHALLSMASFVPHLSLL